MRKLIISPKNMILFLLLVAMTHSQTQSLQISAETMENLLTNIDNIVFNGIQGLSIRKQIRAAFHDCTQGCDGRVGLDKTDNRGLEGFARRMHTFYFDTPIFRDTLSRADFWVLCSRRALAKAIQSGAAQSGFFPTLSPNLPVFNYGRPNITGATTEDSSEGPFPTGLENWPETLSIFKQSTKNMISEAELVTLLGTHNIGTAVQENSGFAGTWGAQADKNSLNTGLYTFLTGVGRNRNFSLIQASSSGHTNSG